ncbi:hypothetical protein [Chromobacterium sp. IIBBL 290-4]|uniref:hypothetical protein n=1 Tax=Chromobacterium sp. IIBBL 290-4 TaxID=2953890 RepID=UPI0020B84D93|nr:hypothetical protein [Chromobacterium sp. IIBBL 290-4]UTH76652.1 hypothetical protein NKT35_11345 [Chromobacterium sp. IIBBL 290-4]
MNKTIWKKIAIGMVLLLLACGTTYKGMRSSLLGMDIADMNKSGFWKASTLVLLSDDERAAISRFTSDKHTNWHTFFTLASGLNVQQVIEKGEAKARTAP